jgi:flagellar biosynthesis protein FlhF
MQVQRFRKPTVREALADVRQALGPDALVLSTMMVPMRGWRRLSGRREVEVTAALSAPLSESRPTAPSSRPRPALLEALAESDSSAVPVTVPQGGAEVVARLQAAGLDRGLATEVVAALPPGARREPPQRLLLDVLAARLAPLGTGGEGLSGIDVFVGPPGAGKTTTIAKIAAQLRAKTGLKPTLVAADGYRVGAVEQLRLYAEILGLPFVVARTAADLDRVLASATRPLLVDTAGRSPADRGTRDLFDALSGRPGVRTHLVMAAGTSPRDAERVFETYAAACPARVVLSKVDETASASALVALVRARQLRVSWIGYGQQVPDDLVAASGTTLASVMLGELGALGGPRQEWSEDLCA